MNGRRRLGTVPFLEVRMMTRCAIVLIGLFVVSCGGSSPAPTSPTPTPTPTPTTFALSGGVIDNKVNSTKVPNASLAIADGANAGRTTTSDGAGNYRFDGLTPGTFTVTSSAPNYINGSQSVTLGTTNKTQNIFMDPVPPPIFKASGVGDNVFTLPSYVARVRVDATYPSSCQNFIVHLNGRGLINVIIGTCSVADTRSPFSGTYATTGGGTVEIVSSTGVAWTFTELR
jgi:hypothetical protein